MHRSPVRARFGSGAAHGNRERLTSSRQEPERVSNQRQGLRETWPRHTLALTDAATQGFERARGRRIPSLSSSTPGSPALLRFTMQEFVHSKHRVSFAHRIGGSRQFMGQDGQRFALAMLVFQPGQGLLALGIVTQQEDRRFRKGPCERGIADLFAGSAVAFPGRFLGALVEAAVGHNILGAALGRTAKQVNNLSEGE
jgi:hypothetical protein